MPMRRHITERLAPGQGVTLAGHPGCVLALFLDGNDEATRMYDVRLPGGIVCVPGSELRPDEAGRAH